MSGAIGATFSYTGTGSCVIDANQAGAGGYAAATEVQQAITVGPAPLAITAPSAVMTVGGAVPVITAGYSGFVNGDGPASLASARTCSTTATDSSPAGTYATTCQGAEASDYAISYTQEPSPSPTTSAGSHRSGRERLTGRSDREIL